jgi:single-strand DNA-binding protein
MNVIILTGNATKDLEIRFNQSGTAIANGTIAVRRDYKNQQGEYETDFHNFVVIGKLGEVMANHIQKGDKFGIKGKLQNRVWEKDNGEKKYFTEVLVDGFDFPNKPKGGQSHNQASGTKDNEDPFANNGQIDISDDDLPF